MTNHGSDDPDLPARAAKRLAQRRAEGRPAGSALDPTELLDELELHQIELEMQNEDLVRARADAEAALALYAELYDLAPIGYFTLGRQGTIARMNILGAKLLGIDRASSGHRLGAFVANASLPAFNAALADVLAGEKEASCEVQLGPDAAGEPRWIHLAMSPAGTGVARAVATDITERRKLTARIHSAQRMEAVGRLAGGVAHDFNNLLTVILGGVETARMTADDGPALLEELQIVTDAANRAAVLTRKLLAFGRKQLLRPEVVDVNALVGELAPVFRTLLGKRGELVLELAPELASIEVDPVQLEHVIVNLIVNAHDAMPDGGTVTLATANDEAHLVLTVTDTGIGMTQEMIEHIFEPFFTTKARDQGQGLGLASVAGIIEQSGGTIAVRSELRAGTSFEIRLPRAAAPRRTSLPPTSESRGGSETILVVDDEAPLRRIAQRILVRAGYTVLVAASGTEALEVFRRHAGTIHLVVCDVIMPGMTGSDLAARIGASHPETKVLFVSGYADDILGRAGVLDRSVRFLAKPYGGESLRAKVREVLD